MQKEMILEMFRGKIAEATGKEPKQCEMFLQKESNKIKLIHEGNTYEQKNILGKNLIFAKIRSVIKSEIKNFDKINFISLAFDFEKNSILAKVFYLDKNGNKLLFEQLI